MSNSLCMNKIECWVVRILWIKWWQNKERRKNNRLLKNKYFCLFIVKMTSNNKEVPAKKQLILTKENLPQVVINVVKKLNRMGKSAVSRQMLHRLEVLFSNEADHIDRDRSVIKILSSCIILFNRYKFLR